MTRIRVTPTWAKVLDFDTRLPTPLEELAEQLRHRVAEPRWRTGAQGSIGSRRRLRLAMKRTRLPEEIRALNAKLRADPALTDNMGPVHVLTVAGRRSGQPQTTPVSPVRYDGQRWLIAGWADADWVKNLRASGWAALTKGTHIERIRVVEVTPKQGAAALRAFVQERGGGRYAFGLDPDAPLESFEREAEAHPIFRIVEVTAEGEGRG
jgi:deazaflavin-dependent oxidoreductase (nitroreductase family)